MKQIHICPSVHPSTLSSLLFDLKGVGKTVLTSFIFITIYFSYLIVIMFFCFSSLLINPCYILYTYLYPVLELVTSRSHLSVLFYAFHMLLLSVELSRDRQ